MSCHVEMCCHGGIPVRVVDLICSDHVSMIFEIIKSDFFPDPMIKLNCIISII